MLTLSGKKTKWFCCTEKAVMVTWAKWMALALSGG